MSFLRPLCRQSKLLRQNTLCGRSFGFSPRRSIPPLQNPFQRFGGPPPHEKPFVEQFAKPRILRAALFALGVGGMTHVFCAVATTIDTEIWQDRLSQGLPWTLRGATSQEMVMARLRAQRDQFKETLKSIHDYTKDWPAISIHLQRLYVIASNSWLLSGEAGQTAWKITMLNTLVFLAWRVPRMHAFMQSNFTHNVLSRKSFTMLTSVFSHASFMHFLFNTLALTSFAPTVCKVLYLRQQDSEEHLQDSTQNWHFIAFFVAAGLASSLFSHAAQSIFRVRPLFAKLSDPARASQVASAIQSGQQLMPSSLGASGAIYAMVAYSALGIPSASVNIMFIPIAIPIGWAVSGTICLDILGIIRGWRMFDHWAHLGGAMFGFWYYFKGATLWETLRLAGEEDEGEENS